MSSDRVRFRNDYDFETETDSKGRVKRKAVYKGDYHYRDLPGEEVKQQKKRFLQLLIPADFLFLVVLLTSSPANCSTLIGILELFQLVPALFLTLGILRNLKAPRMLTRQDYKDTALTILTASFLWMVYGCILALFRLVWAVIAKTALPFNLLMTVCAALNVFFCFLIWQTERKTPYGLEKGEKHQADLYPS